MNVRIITVLILFPLTLFLVAQNLCSMVEKKIILNFLDRVKYHSVQEELKYYGSDINARETESGYSLLHFAVIQGDLKVVKALLDAGANPNVQDNKGRTPLFSSNNVDIIKMLLESEADPDSPSPNGYTRLHIAIQDGKDNIVTVLLNAKANPNLQTDWGEASLHFAVKKSNSSKNIVKMLLDNGAQPNLQIKYLGKTPLYIAVEHKVDKDIIKMLLEAGANPNIKNTHGETPYYVAMTQKNDIIEEMLINAGAVVPLDSYKLKKILKLIIKQGFTTAKKQKKFSIDVEDTERNTLLHLAVKQDNLIAVQELLTNGANVNAENIDWNTPLHLAVQKGNVAILQVLLTNGANVNAENKDQNTPLHLVVQKDNLEIAQLLLDKDANPNKFNKKELSPLHIAAMYGNQKIVQLLLDKGALDISRFGHGEKPSDIADRRLSQTKDPYGQVQDKENNKKFSEIVRFFYRPCRWTNDEKKFEEFYILIKHKKVEAALQEGFFDINVQLLPYKNTLLHYAIFFNDEATVKKLLDNGADTNLKGDNLTPLELAKKHGLQNIVDIFEAAQPIPKSELEQKITSLKDSLQELSQKLTMLSKHLKDLQTNLQ